MKRVVIDLDDKYADILSITAVGGIPYAIRM